MTPKDVPWKFYPALTISLPKEDPSIFSARVNFLGGRARIGEIQSVKILRSHLFRLFTQRVNAQQTKKLSSVDHMKVVTMNFFPLVLLIVLPTKLATIHVSANQL
jgi:hypothetical protein